MVDPSGSTAYVYDVRDRLTNKLVSFTGGPAVTLSYGYNANGSVTNIASSTSGGVNLAYSYDPLDRLTNALANGGGAASYGFDLVGNLQTLRYGTAVTNTYQYDSLNRLTNLACTTVSGTVASFYYQLGLTGNRTNLMESVNGFKRTNSWSYDSLYRLVNEIIKTNGGNSVLGYSYDSVGNRLGRTIAGSNLSLTNQTFTFNTNDWLNTDKYDGNGNTTNASGNAYQYDALNHVTNVNNTVFITYDGDGNRVSKTVGGTTTYYLVDDRNPSGYAQVLEEWTSTGTPVLSRVYNYGLSLISQRQPSVSTNYFIYDGHGSTRELLDAGGNLVNTFAYDAYGTLIASGGSPQTAYLYCGQQLDSDLGLYYNRARYLNTGTGRFWTMDTYEGNNEDPPSLHKYLYCHADPINGIDPSGYDTYTMPELAVTMGEQGKEFNGVAAVASLAYQEMQRSIIFRVGAYLTISALVAENVAMVAGPFMSGDPGTSPDAQELQLKQLVKLRLEQLEQKNHGQLLYHYTSLSRAQSIVSQQYIYPSSEYTDPSTRAYYPSGAYATDISPVDDFSQQELASTLYFNPAKASGTDLSCVVVLLNIRPRGFTYITSHQYCRADGQVYALEWLPNPMAEQ